MHDGVEQQALRVYQEMALLALDLLSRILTRRINATPPFSAPLTLWLSMSGTRLRVTTAAVGLASRSVNSRHCTRHCTESA